MSEKKVAETLAEELEDQAKDVEIVVDAEAGAAEEAPAAEAAEGDIVAAQDDSELALGDYDLEDDYESEDSLTFSNGVIEKIVAIAMRDVPGVVGMKGGFINRIQDAFGARDARKGVSVEVTPDSSVKVNISILMEYGAFAPQVFEDVKKTVVKQVTGMTGLTVAGINLRIEDVLTPEEVAARRGDEQVTPRVEEQPAEDEEAAEQEEPQA